MAAEDFLNSVQSNQSLGDKIDKSMIAQASVPGYEEDLINRSRIASQPKEIGRQDFNDLYPGLSQNIQAGTYSGSIVGSNPIYVHGGDILALNPILERRKNLQDAAMLRAQQLKPIETPDSYKLKDARYQPKMDEFFYNGLNNVLKEAYDEFGAEAPVVISDPGSSYYKRIKELDRGSQNFGKNFDQTATLLAKVDEDSRSNSKLFPPEAHELSKQFQSMTGPVFGSEGGIQNIDQLNNVHDKLQGYQTLAGYLDENIVWKDFEGAVSSRFKPVGGNEYYSYSTEKTTDFNGIKKQIGDEIENGMRPQIEAGLVTREQIDQTVDSRLQNKKEITGGSMSQKRAGTEDISTVGEPVVYDPKNPQKPRISTFNRDGSVVPNGEVDYTELAYIPVSGFKPASIDNPMIINGNDMSYKLTDVVDFTLTGMATIENDKKGDQRKVGYGKATMNVDYYEGRPTDRTGKRGAVEELTKEQYEALPKGQEKNYSKKQKKQDVDIAVVLDEAAVGSIKAANKNAKIDEGVTFLESKKTKGKKESSEPRYSQAQEENIKATMKANPKASRGEVIKALGYK